MYKNIDTKEVYNVKDIAKLFHVTPTTVRRWINEKGLKAVKVGRDFIVNEKDLFTFTKGANINTYPTLTKNKSINLLSQELEKEEPFESIKELKKSLGSSEFLNVLTIQINSLKKNIEDFENKIILARNELKMLLIIEEAVNFDKDLKKKEEDNKNV